MRRFVIIVSAAVAVAALAPPARATAVDPLEYSPVCNLSGSRPCTRTVCTQTSGARCAAHVLPQLAQDLRLLIKSRSRHGGRAPERPVTSLRELYTALRRCWEPPAREDAHFGMEMSVRFAFKSSGEIVSPPRVTYSTEEVDASTRNAYHDAVTASLERCTPMPLSKGFGSAIAGRPIAIRFVDDRTD
jgi:hypothetical protein